MLMHCDPANKRAATHRQGVCTKVSRFIYLATQASTNMCTDPALLSSCQSELSMSLHYSPPLLSLPLPRTLTVAKYEFFNAGGSVKDRIGLKMVEDAEINAEKN